MIASFSQEIIAIRDARCKKPGFFPDPALKKNSQSLIALVARADRAVSARVFPNGEFGVGFIPHRGIYAKDRRYESDRRYAEQNAEIIADIEIDADIPEGFRYTRKVVPGSPPKLGKGSESSRVRKKYGTKGITSYGRKIVRNAGHLLDKANQHQYNRFMKMGTVTLPSYSPESMKNIAANWADIVRKFFQKLRRIYARKFKPFYYVAVSEIQPTRLRERNEVGLHLHFLFTAIRLGRGKWVLPHNVVREKWEATINHYLVEGEEPQGVNYRCEDVNGASAGYLGKYMSKGGEEVQKVVQEFGEEFIPSQWWSMDNATRRCIAAHTISSRSSVAYQLLHICSEDIKEYLLYKRVMCMEVETNQYAEVHGAPKEIVLGYGGRLSFDGFRLFSPGNQCESAAKYLPRTLDNSGRN